MSVISAVLTQDYIIVSTDSVLSFEVNGIRLIDDDSYKKPKYVPFIKLKCIASYWGLAYIKVGHKKVWQVYEWLQSKVEKQEQFDSVESFGKHLVNDLESIFEKYKLKNSLEYGIGIHLTAFENFGGVMVPELFLLSNFKSTDYTVVGSLTLSRRTFFDLTEGELLHYSLEEQRKIYSEFLSQGRFSFYNNGDPQVFNLFANAYHKSILIAKSRGKLKGSLDKNFYKKLASQPITQVSKFQKEYYVKGSVIVGGKTHTILMDKNGAIEKS